MKKAGNLFTLKRLSVLVCSALALAFTSCMDDDFDNATDPTPVAYVSFYHGAPSAADLDLYIDNSKVNNQPFKFAVFSDYLNLQTTTSRKIKFTPSNASNVLIDSTITFKENKIYSLFAVGLQQDLDLLVLEDSLKVPSAGKANIRVVHISPDAPAIDVATTGTNGTTVFTDITYKEDSNFKEVTAGNTTFQVKEQGTETVLLSVPDLNLQSGRIYTLVLRGLKTPPTGNTNNLSLQVLTNY